MAANFGDLKRKGAGLDYSEARDWLLADPSFSAKLLPQVHQILNLANYALVDTDNNKILLVKNAGGATLTVPAGLLNKGFACKIVNQCPSGAVTIAPGGGVSLRNRLNRFTIPDIYGAVDLIGLDVDLGMVDGDTGNETEISAVFGPLGVPLINPKVISTSSRIGVAAGDTDLYTVPAGKKALVLETIFSNPTGSGVTIAATAEVKIAGVYTKFDFITVGTAEGNYGKQTILVPFLLNAGESFAINCNNAGLSIWPFIVEFDAATPIATARLTAFAAGDNLLFTAPSAGIQFASFVTSGTTGPLRGCIYYYNKSGVNRNVSFNAVPFGGAVAVGNRIASIAALADNTVFTPPFYGGLAQGDFLNINVDANTAGQIAWIIYQLLP